MNLTPEERILALAARQNFTRAHAEEVQREATRRPVDWDLFLETARWHRVLPIVHRNLGQAAVSLPPAFADSFRSAVDQFVSLKRERLEGLREFLAEIAFAPIMLVKGAALDATVYEEEWYTMGHDFDVIMDISRSDIPADRLERMAERIEELGFIEMGFQDHHDISMNSALPIDYRAAWRDARPMTWHGNEILVPSPEDALLFCAINCCRKKFFNLKSHCDLDALINHYHDLDWRALEEKARACRADVILYAALEAHRRLMGADLPPAPMRSLRPSLARRLVINALLERKSFANLRSLYYPKRDPRTRSRLGKLLPYACYRWRHLGHHVGSDLARIGQRLTAGLARRPGGHH